MDDITFANPSNPNSETHTVLIDEMVGVETDNRIVSVAHGKDVNIVVDAVRGRRVTSLRLQMKNHTAKASVSTGQVWLGGEKYLIDADGGRITLRLTDVREDMSVYFYTDDVAEVLPEGYCSVTSIGGAGASVDAATLDVKRGDSVTVSAKAQSGYKIEAVRMEDGTRQKTADVSDGRIELNGKTYRIDRNGKQVTVPLTDVQDNMTVRFYTDRDRKEQPYVVTVGGDDESKIERENLKVKQGGSADITAEAKPGYKIIEAQLDDGAQSARAKVSEGRIWNGDRNYRIEESNGRVTLRLTDVQRDMSVFFYTGIDEKNIPVTISEKAQNCSIKTSRDTVEKGGAAIYTVQPANGYSLDKITLRIGETEATASVHAGMIKVGTKSYKMQITYDGVVTVTVDDIADKVELHAETVAAGYPYAPSHTASLTAPTYPSSVNLYLRADIRSPYIRGYGNGRFGPKNTLTRAEAVAMLASLTNYDAQTAYKPFGAPDVDQKAWYANAVNAFYAAAIERDTASFRPAAAITRGELAIWLYRLSRSPAVPSGALSFPDTYGHTELNSATAYGRSMGWINGYEDGMFRPDNSLIRAEAAKLLNRATRRPLQVTNYITSFTDVPYTYWAYSEIQSAANYV